MRREDLINHLYGGCGICREAGFEFEKYLKNHRKLKVDKEKILKYINDKLHCLNAGENIEMREALQDIEDILNDKEMIKKG